MSKSTKSPGSKWGRPSPVQDPQSSNGGEQGNKDASVAAVVERDEERKIQGVDIADYSKGSLDDDASEAEEDDELDEAETVEEEARVNQR
jgi:hypothetical protein